MSPVWRDPSPEDRVQYPPPEVYAAGIYNHHIANTAYPIAHGSTWRAYRVATSTAPAAARAFRGVEDLCLYVHVPFCQARCGYCEYTVVGPDDARQADAYVDDLMVEIDLWHQALGHGRRLVHGLDFGGGTPGVLPAETIHDILERLRTHYRFAPQSDVSIETTPRLAASEPSKLAAYRRSGIDRLSMGVQVAEPALLGRIGREGNGPAVTRRAAENVRAAGFTRFNVDLMYGFAGQSAASWRATLDHAVALGPDSITLYRMRYKGTRLVSHATRVTLAQVQELQRLAGRVLGDSGYHAPPGKNTYTLNPFDPGTSSYLTQRVVEGMPYLGLGLGAQSLSPTTVSYNLGAAAKTLLPYARSIARRQLPIQDLYDLPARQLMAKFCAVSFYFGAIAAAAFHTRFGVELGEAYGEEIDFVLGRGLMAWRDGFLSLTPTGALAANGVIALFLAPSVQRVLLERHAQAGGTSVLEPAEVGHV